MYRSTLLLLGVALWVAPAYAQDLTVERDGDTATVTFPDGSTHTFTLDEDTPLRLRVEDRDVVIAPEGSPSIERRFRFRREGGPEAFAFHLDPDDLPGVEGLAPHFRFHADSLMGSLRRFHVAPGEFDVELSGMALGMRGVSPELRRQIAEAERESRELAARARQAEGAEADRLRQDLRATLERAFDLRMQARRERLERLHADAAQLAEDLEQRQATRREMIERRERQLLGERDGLDW